MIDELRGVNERRKCGREQIGAAEQRVFGVVEEELRLADQTLRQTIVLRDRALNAFQKA